MAHIHTFNDADIIDITIESVLKQTRPVDGILVVDNASTDNTLDQPSLKHVTVVRHQENLGTSGAVVTGMRFALERGYDWIWVFDADSVPELDALEKLLRLHGELPETVRDVTAFLACLPRNHGDDRPHHGVVFTRKGIAIARPLQDERHYLCHVTIWSGCLYPLAAILQVGLPNHNYVLDWGEFEYGYRMMKAGYHGFIHQDSILQHNIRGAPSFHAVELNLGFATATVYEFPPIRCYYMSRNMLYFALYDVELERFGLGRRVVWTVFRLTANFLLRPRNHGAQILACLRGIWHGITGNVVARY
ncbi:MAG: glycosyltransferase [Methylocella sp.]